VHRLTETLCADGQEIQLSAQNFADNAPAESGNFWMKGYCIDGVPVWQYRVGAICVDRTCAMAYGENTTAVIYSLHNATDMPCTFTVAPYLKFAPKETALTERKKFTINNNRIIADGYTLYLHTEGEIVPFTDWQDLDYPADAEDGRSGHGLAGSCCNIRITVPAMSKGSLDIVFSTEKKVAPAKDILKAETERLSKLEQSVSFSDPVARQLAVSADSYIAKRDSTGGKTILAGYPLFSDWGRDTMIALPGCCLATGRYEDAKSILQTFLAYEKDGLVPNLFPEGNQAPMYNTVDAALLLMDAVWQYYERTADLAFVKEAWPVMERIVTAYVRGTHHHIGMDTDGLIYAGEGVDQVTWMDVRIDDILPTPRHGKPVEINAYWYNALKIMEKLAPLVNAEGKEYAVLAQRVKESFLDKFYIREKGYLKDVLSGTSADEQIRCNQIWALSMSFTMLPAEWERSVLDTVTEHLLTPCGLRTLSPKDPQYHGFYGGSQLKRDMAYHQGTVWVFPMGAYYRAYLRMYGRQGIPAVRQRLENISNMLQEGCAGQLPEIYDGDYPQKGKGCHAQAWSVGEMLRVYEMLEQMENP
jgi:predicted glycogen debranching enzyme